MILHIGADIGLIAETVIDGRESIIYTLANLVNIGHVGIERLVAITQATSDVLYRVVILIGGIGSDSGDVVVVIIHTLLDLSGLVTVTCTQAPVGIEAPFTTNANDV